jgi:uncharacterized RDD family membrane protein YckC
MAGPADFLHEEYTIDTPENVTFGYEVAGIGNRFIAALLDGFLLAMALGLLNILVLVALHLAGALDGILVALDETELSWMGGLLLALYALLNFSLIWGYFFAFELLWNGQTPGKRVAKVRVVRLDGNPAGFTESAVRNLVRIIDFLPAGYGVGLVTMFFNRQARRLGDLAAGTLVVKDRGEIGLDSLGGDVASPVEEASSGGKEIADAWLPWIGRLSNLSAADYELIAEVLARYDRGGMNPAFLHRVAVVMAAKLAVSPPPQNRVDNYEFLNNVAEAYRRFGT